MHAILRHRALAAAVVLALVTIAPARAADPPSATISEAQPVVSWTGEFMPRLPNPDNPFGSDCGGPSNPACDRFILHVVPPSFSYELQFRLVPALIGDWDIEVYGPDGTRLGRSGNFPGQIDALVLRDPPGGTYTVVIAPFVPMPVSPSYTATATIARAPITPPGTEPLGYSNHVPPSPMDRLNAGEPSIGVNRRTGAAMYIAGLRTLRVRFDDTVSPSRATWEDVSFRTTSLASFDPILFTDPAAGRTFVSQLVYPARTSLMAFTDDDGDTWIPSQGSGIGSGEDHQTVGGGPFAPPLTRTDDGPLYPNTVYYCSQDKGLTAYCASSLNGGVTFGPAIPIYGPTQCGFVHGHVQVAPDGTVYVPSDRCGQQAVIVSEDNGMTWHVRHLPASTMGTWDPSAAIASDGTVYFGYADGDGHPKVAVSHDKGLSWTNIRDVGASVTFGTQTGIVHTSFPAMVAGDPDRAAFAFLGSTEPTPGALDDDPAWPGQWHLYVAHTYDGGDTWTTVDVTPGDPVQRGTICIVGSQSCPKTRNLLDFMGATIDAQGRVLVGYADGCVRTCVNARPNSGTANPTIARQSCGRTLFAAFDAVARAC